MKVKQRIYDVYKASKNNEYSYSVLEPSLKIYRKLFHASDLHQKRRFQAFCVGTPRSGTHSIARIFEKNFRSHHEPGMSELAEKIIQRWNAKDPRPCIHQWLKIRDLEFYLEMEASHPLNYIIEDLVNVFPEAKFILTLRDCFSWLKSETNKSHQPREEFWKKLEAIRYGVYEYDHTLQDEILKEYGLYPICSYLNYWKEHNERIIKNIPPDRLLIIKTKEISHKLNKIADFIGVPSDKLDISNSHIPGVAKADAFDVFSVVNYDYIRYQADVICGDLMSKYFPEVS